MGVGPEGIDLSAVVTWPQAMAFIALVFAVLVWPSIGAWLSSRRTNRTLTTTNGGGHVKDQLDRIERQGEKNALAAIENATALAALTGRFDEHVGRRADDHTSRHSAI